MLLGYNTNGFAHHDPLQAIQLLGELGYRSVALSIDHQLLKPGFSHIRRQVSQVSKSLSQYNMSSVIETGARFLLDACCKHEPTLVSPDPAERKKRCDFLKHAIDMAHQLGSDCVSLWSGVLRDGISEQEAYKRLVDALHDVIEYAESNDVVIGFEPEPGMFIDSMARYKTLASEIDSPAFKLTLDIGHLHCMDETPIPNYIKDSSTEIVNIHIEDIRGRVHEHLMFGEGDIDFPPIIQALKEIDYQGGVHVELSRNSHQAPTAATAAYQFLSPLLK